MNKISQADVDRWIQSQEYSLELRYQFIRSRLERMGLDAQMIDRIIEFDKDQNRDKSLS